MGLKISVN